MPIQTPIPPGLADMKEARKLATQIVKQSVNTRVKFGTTNGRLCLHLATDHRKEDRGFGGTRSTTIYSEAEWEEHPENVYNKPRAVEDELIISGVAEAIANKEAV
jgi:hypothetical protein